MSGGGSSDLNRALVPLRDRTIETLRHEGYDGEPEIEQRLEMRYFGQNYHREIAIVPHAPISAERFPVRLSRRSTHDYEAVLRVPPAR